MPPLSTASRACLLSTAQRDRVVGVGIRKRVRPGQRMSVIMCAQIFPDDEFQRIGLQWTRLRVDGKSLQLNDALGWLHVRDRIGVLAQFIELRLRGRNTAS